MDIELIKKQCEKSIKKFENSIGSSINYIPNGIFLWEGFAFCVMLDFFDIDLIIESGVAGGRSTEIWAKYFDKKIYAIDNARCYGEGRFNNTVHRLSKFNNIIFIKGNAFFEMVNLIKKNLDAKIAIFLDGPKGKDAILLAKMSFRYSNIKFVGIHDQCKGNYHEMDMWDKTVFYSDAQWFLEKYSYLDLDNHDQILLEELKRFPNGPGIGFAVNTKSCRKKDIYKRFSERIHDDFLLNKCKLLAFIDDAKHNLKMKNPEYYQLLKKIKSTFYI